MPGLEGDTSKRAIATGLLIAGLCIATFLAKAHLVASQVDPGYGDVAHYFALARNLFEGRGMWVDYSAWWLSDPRGLPVSGSAFWMPMPSWIGALGMLARGEATFHAACEGMVAFTSIAPLVAYLNGRDLLGSPRLGVLAAFLAATLHMFLDKASLPLTHGPAMVFGGLALWATVRSLSDRRFLWAAGALAALAQQNRSDGIVWLAVIALAHLLRPGGRTPFLALWPAALTWALAMAPLLVSNVMTQGRPWPDSLLRAAVIRTYPELYSLPERLTVARFLEQGFARIATDKAAAAWENAVTFVTGTAAGSGMGLVTRSPLDVLGKAPLGILALALIGAHRLFERRLAAFWIHAGLQWALYSFLFTHSGRASFRAALFALYPLVLAVAAHGVVATASALARIVPSRLARARTALAVLLGALALSWVTWENATYAAQSVRGRGAGNARGRAVHLAIVDRLIAPHALQDETFLISHQSIHSFHANTRIRAATIPFAAELEEIRDAAARVGATHLILDDRPFPIHMWRALAELPESPLFERVDSVRITSETFTLYRIALD